MDERALFLKAAGHAADYRATIGERPQRPLRDYAASIDVFCEELPDIGPPAEQVLDELTTKAEPGLHSMTGPRFLAWVIGGSHPMGVAADMLTSAWSQNTGNHIATPSASAVETASMRWLLDVLRLPPECSVGFVTGATVANFTCLAAARGAVLRGKGWDPDTLGLFGAPPVTVLIGDDAHTTVFSALQFLGLGHDRGVRVPTDDQGRIRTDAFARALEAATGPLIVIMQAGQINTGACDDFATLIPLAKKHGAWVHVDGAFGLWAQASPRTRHLSAGVELADSWATDGHKWLQTPYDCGYAIVRDELAHRRAMTIAASYLPVSEGERDPSHYVPELSRRARGFATWAMLKHLGRQGVADLVDRACVVARHIAERVSREPGIAVLNDVTLNQAILRFGSDLSQEAADRLTQDTIRVLQRSGVIFAGGATWRGAQVMRISVCNYRTDLDQADIVAREIVRAYRETRSGGSG
jgi:glutamate/tyrosine decarboxylase-like PLP-dependent enzyme